MSLDRLEQAGYVRRTSDAADRRRVVVEVVPERLSAIREALEPLGDAHAAVVAEYSDEELELINGFLSKMADAEQARAEARRGRPRAGSPTRASTVRRSARSAGRACSCGRAASDLSVTGSAQPRALSAPASRASSRRSACAMAPSSSPTAAACARSSTGASAALASR